jgi:hypothetical protein
MNEELHDLTPNPPNNYCPVRIAMSLNSDFNGKKKCDPSIPEIF